MGVDKRIAIDVLFLVCHVAQGLIVHSEVWLLVEVTAHYRIHYDRRSTFCLCRTSKHTEVVIQRQSGVCMPSVTDFAFLVIMSELYHEVVSWLHGIIHLLPVSFKDETA